MSNAHKGSSFDDFLEEEKMLDHAQAVAIKRVVAYKIEKLMKQRKLNKAALASKMQTSRSSLDRLLDPDNTSVTLNSLVRAANALGKSLDIRLSR
jgi:antitoxin HicB